MSYLRNVWAIVWSPPFISGGLLMIASDELADHRWMAGGVSLFFSLGGLAFAAKEEMDRP